MRISILTPDFARGTPTGYGTAEAGLITSLTTLGHDVSYADAYAPVELAFCMPPFWKWTNPDAYHIGYVPWESTKLPLEWFANLCTTDELWATSPWVKSVYENRSNKQESVRVFQHGVDPFVWNRKRRRYPFGKPRAIKFLHIGEPAPRKGGQLVYDVFRDTFGDSLNVHLTIKAHGVNTIPQLETFYEEDGHLRLNPGAAEHTNVTVITDELSESELVKLVHDHDVLVYPSYGEGFGLIPLQAMVTGMPVICTERWAPYKHLLERDLALASMLVKSPWPDIHPGNMYEPDREMLRLAMLDCSNPSIFADYSARAYARSFAVEREYDWLGLTREAFAHVVEKFS